MPTRKRARTSSKAASRARQRPAPAQRRRRAAKKKQTAKKARAKKAGGLASDLRDLESSFTKLFTDLTGEITDGALRLAARTGGVPLEVARALAPSAERLGPLDPERLEMMKQTGLYLRELRELAGLTISDLREALDLRDNSILEAVENGTATLSFELILRLAALLARHDPVPFVISFTRTYNPEIWQILEDWGIGRIPTQYEREREFLNIFRSQDSARRLSDEGFDKILEFTRSAFNLSLHFIAEQEGVKPSAPRSKRAAQKTTAKRKPSTK